ncbi:hypothetical protein GF377_06285 [candidate division GN15 bacterium]|nr:hypothetical protein [candidate division GN15 bacterium]
MQYEHNQDKHQEHHHQPSAMLTEKPSRAGRRTRRKNSKSTDQRYARYLVDNTTNRMSSARNRRTRSRRDDWRISRNQIQNMDISALREYMEADEGLW